jgi:hypothetical protein
LIAESRLYRYPTPAERDQLGENPIDAHNHALAALRYLVSRISVRKESGGGSQESVQKPAPVDDDALWTSI